MSLQKGRTFMEWMQLAILAVTIGAGFVTWNLNENSKRKQEDYLRREAHYIELVRSLRGFHVGSDDAEAKATFLTELEISWLYGSDDVIRAAYAFLHTMMTDVASTEADRNASLGRLVLAIRLDLIGRSPLEHTSLKASEFEILGLTK